jgi:hypothetical protein
MAYSAICPKCKRKYRMDFTIGKLVRWVDNVKDTPANACAYCQLPYCQLPYSEK